MCVALHWDGAHAHGLHSTPICVGVGNTNRMSADTKYCIGYMPVLEDMGGAFEGDSIQIKHVIRQQCTAAILRVLETAARSGVICNLPNCTGSESRMILFPRLISMNMDSPDARLYFGLRSRTCCSKCKRRKGRSAFRKASEQSGHAVQTLYGILENNVDTR